MRVPMLTLPPIMTSVGYFLAAASSWALQVVSLTQASIITILAIPATNDEARTNLNGPARDGKEALTIPTNGDGGTGLQTSHYLQTQITRTQQHSRKGMLVSAYFA